MSWQFADGSFGQLWSASGEKVVERANWLKFSQNTEFMKVLLSTGNKLLVESSPEDRIVSQLVQQGFGN